MTPETARFGEVKQIAYVPVDVAGALKFWTETMGAGPFYAMPHVVMESQYRGQAATMDFSVYLGNYGDLQVEIIDQHDDQPSTYREFREQGRDGIHHVAVLVPNLDRAREEAVAGGGTVVQSIWNAGGGAIYVDFDEAGAPLVEFIEMAEGLEAVFGLVREAARDWDGSDPIRQLG